jgi:hypothetical protein
MRRRIAAWTVFVTIASLLMLVGCNQNSENAQAQRSTSAQNGGGQTGMPAGHPPVEGMAPSASGGSSPTVVAGVSYTVPSEWIDGGPGGMRAAQFQLPPQGEDTAPAEVSVFYFGPASGGGVDANIDRWMGQMTQPDGGSSAERAERETFEVDGMVVHMVSVDGTYNAGSMGGGGGPAEGYRMVGAIVEGPQGSVFFKLTGPLETAQAMEAGLRDLVQSFQNQG